MPDYAFPSTDAGQSSDLPPSEMYDESPAKRRKSSKANSANTVDDNVAIQYLTLAHVEINLVVQFPSEFESMMNSILTRDNRRP